MDFAFAIGEHVEARQHLDPEWKLAIVTRHEPYLGRPGYYVSYPDATEQWHCHGGWKAETSLRKAATPPPRQEGKV